MPYVNNDSLDDQLYFDSQADFSGGQNSITKASLLAANQGALVKNWLTNISGELVKRRGTRGILPLDDYPSAQGDAIQALLNYDAVASDETVAFSGGDAYRVNGDYWTLYFAASVTDHDEQIYVVQYTDKIYWTDSSKTGIRKFDGATVSTVSGSPAATILIKHGTRLVASGVSSVPDAVYFGDFLSDTWDQVNKVIRVGGGTGDPVVGLMSWLNTYVVVLCRKSVYLIEANPLNTVANFSVQTVQSLTGCLAGHTVVQVGQDVWFLGRGGVQSLQLQLQTSNTYVISPAASSLVNDVIESVNWQYAFKSIAAYYNNYYLIALPTGSATEPNTMLAFNTLRNSWAIMDGFDAHAMIEQPYGGKTRLLIGCNSGEVRQSLDILDAALEEDPATFADGIGSLTLPFNLPANFPGATNVVALLRTRGLTFGEPVSQKSGVYCEIEFRSRLGVVYINAIRDGGASEPIGVVNFNAGAIYLPFNLPITLPDDKWVRQRFPLANINTNQWLPPFRELQIEINATYGGCAVRSITCTAFLDTTELQ